MLLKLLLSSFIWSGGAPQESPNSTPPAAISAEKAVEVTRKEISSLANARIAIRDAAKIPNECDDLPSRTAADCGRRTCRDCRRSKALRKKATQSAEKNLSRSITALEARLLSWKPLPNSEPTLSKAKYAALFREYYNSFSVSNAGFYRVHAKSDDGLPCEARILDHIGIKIIDLGIGIAWLEPGTRYQFYSFSCTERFEAIIEPFEADPNSPVRLDPKKLPPLKIR